MLSICGPEEEPINEIKVGKIISSIWGNTVKKSRSTSANGSGYINLHFRHMQNADEGKIETLDEKIVDGIRKVCERFEDWIVDLSSRKKGMISLLKVRNTNFVNDAEVMVDRGRVFPEIIVSLYPHSQHRDWHTQ